MYKNEYIRLDCLAKTQDMAWGKTGCNQVKSLAGHFSIMLKKKIQQKTIWPVRSSWRSWGFFWHTKCYLAQILKKQTSFTVSWESIRAFDLFHTLRCDCNITGYICCQFWSELNSDDMFLTFFNYLTTPSLTWILAVDQLGSWFESLLKLFLFIMWLHWTLFWCPGTC